MKTELMEHTEGGATLEGYATYIATGDKRPGILLCPDWMAISGFAKMRNLKRALFRLTR